MTPIEEATAYLGMQVLGQAIRSDTTNIHTYGRAILAALIAAPEPIRAALADALVPWRDIKDAPKDGALFLSAREGERGLNVCYILFHPKHHSEPEYVEASTGRTTVTHHSFAAPTHFKPLPVPPKKEG